MCGRERANVCEGDGEGEEGSARVRAKRRACVWDLERVRVVSVWGPCGVCVGFVWGPCGIWKGSMWVPCGVNVGSVWGLRKSVCGLERSALVWGA